MNPERILALLFPPSLKSLGKIPLIVETEFQEQGACSKPKRKKYRDGIERVFAEQAGEQ